MNTSPKPSVWFITGASQGFGRELVRAALQRGDSVVATSRRPETVAAAFPNETARLLALPLDLRNELQINSTVERAIARFSRIDFLVNNAGHGFTGAIEEATDAEVHSVFETNVFGLLRVTRAVLPQLRKQGRGHIVNLSSISGLVGLPGWGIYNASKFAVEGISEALAAEVAPFGIGVTIVEPGPFRTNFLGDSMATTAKIIPDYEKTAGQVRSGNVQRNGRQPGSPALGADAIVRAVTSPKPPLHLLLGGFAYERFNAKLAALHQEIETWRETTLATDFKT
jgi:NAD(P)-dependent dehydrogenase (short-subunit alcohol dehydrogenase family)